MKKPTKLVIVGAGGLGREALATARAANEIRKRWKLMGFLDADPKLRGREVAGMPILGGDDWWRRHQDSSVRFFCAIGNPGIRAKVVERLSGEGARFVSVIHPSVSVPESVEVAAGTIVMAGTRFTTDAKVGAHSILYLNCAITHDVEIGDFCLLGSGCNLSGAVVLESGVQLGTGASVLPQRKIGAWATIGAGSVVTKDIPARSTAAGVPCRVIRQGK